MGQKMGQKIGQKMSQKIGQKVGQKMGQKNRPKNGSNLCIKIARSHYKISFSVVIQSKDTGIYMIINIKTNKHKCEK